MFAYFVMIHYENKWILISLINPIKTIRKVKHVFKSCKLHFSITFKELNGNIFWFSKPKAIQIVAKDVIWKDKWDTPRFEGSPYLWIGLFGLNIQFYWKPKVRSVDAYWEQVLWYLYYAQSNMNKACETWPWQDLTGKSTWTDKFLNNDTKKENKNFNR